MPKNFLIVNFGHPISKSWLRSWFRNLHKLFASLLVPPRSHSYSWWGGIPSTLLLTLMLLVANLAITKGCKKSLKWLQPWHTGKHLRVLKRTKVVTDLEGLKLPVKMFSDLCKLFASPYIYLYHQAMPVCSYTWRCSEFKAKSWPAGHLGLILTPRPSKITPQCTHIFFMRNF